MSVAAPRFVVQHHLATADHYDFRLEIDGVLVSWAVPRGPSTDPQVRRMAIRTDDHDVEHASVEGVLGGTAVLVWDQGTFQNTSRDHGTPIDAAAGLARGHLSFRLDGAKLYGGYALIRLPDQRRETWLLIKKADESADPFSNLTRDEPASVLSGRTLEEIRGDAQPDP